MIRKIGYKMKIDQHFLLHSTRSYTMTNGSPTFLYPLLPCVNLPAGLYVERAYGPLQLNITAKKNPI
jgi:hypothetical protein